MKPILSLTNETEIVRLMLEEVTSEGMTGHETEARAGCNCDRWGHPWSDCGHSRVELKRERPFPLPLDE